MARCGNCGKTSPELIKQEHIWLGDMDGMIKSYRCPCGNKFETVLNTLMDEVEEDIRLLRQAVDIFRLR